MLLHNVLNKITAFLPIHTDRNYYINQSAFSLGSRWSRISVSKWLSFAKGQLDDSAREKISLWVSMSQVPNYSWWNRLAVSFTEKGVWYYNQNTSLPGPTHYHSARNPPPPSSQQVREPKTSFVLDLFLRNIRRRLRQESTPGV